MTTDRKVQSVPKTTTLLPETAAGILATWPEFQAQLKDTPYLNKMRQKALSYVQTHGLPTPKLEGWKYTNIIPAVKKFGATQGQTKVSYNPVEGVEVTPLVQSVVEQDWVRDLITEDAHYSDDNADPTLWHLSNLYFRDGVSIDVPAGLDVKAPLNITMEAYDDAFFMVHTAIRVGANARLIIVEDHCGTGTFWKNRLSHIQLEPGAHLTHVRIQRDSAESVYTQNTKVSVAADAHYNAVAVYTGAAISRNQVHVVLNGQGASAHINGVSMMRGVQHSDTTVLIEHLAPNGESKQNIRTILDDQAHGVFQGKIHVHKPAQKTDGYQLSRALILSEGAEMDTKPELEIYADDVKCSHGSTTGQMDQEPLFYMRSRGIAEADARALLVESFCAEVIDTVEDDAVKARLKERIVGWLT